MPTLLRFVSAGFVCISLIAPCLLRHVRGVRNGTNGTDDCCGNYNYYLTAALSKILSISCAELSRSRGSTLTGAGLEFGLGPR